MAAVTQLIFDILANDKASAKLKNVDDSLTKSGKSWDKWSVATAGLTAAAGAALMKFGKDAVAAASNLEEMRSKAQTVFGASARYINEFATGAANDLNLSERAAYEATSTFGQFFLAAGMGSTEAAKMSVSISTLAADLASFNNVDPAVAIEKLRAGLAGEAEPLRAFGVFLSDAAVQAKAAEMGIGRLGAKLTEGEKVQVRYQIILDQTAQAQGDVARTADSYANKQRDLAENTEELAAAVGKNLTPALGNLMGSLAKAAEGFNAMDAATSDWMQDALAQQGIQVEKNAATWDLWGETVGKWLENYYWGLTESGDLTVFAVDREAEALDRSMDAWGARYTAQSRAYDQQQAVNESLAEGAPLTEEQSKAVEDLAKSLDGMIEPLDLYTQMTRDLATATAESTESSEDSWETYVDSVTVSIADYLTQLEAQKAAQDQWATNMLLLSARVSQGTLDQLSRLGPEGAPLVAQLVTASDEELARLEAVFGARTDAAAARQAAALITAGPVLRQIAATNGDAVAAETAAAIARGEISVAEAAARYGVAIATGVEGGQVGVTNMTTSLDQFVQAWQGRTVTVGAVQDAADFDRGMAAWAARYTGQAARYGLAQGGAVVGAGGPTDDAIPAMLSNGEYVFSARAVQELGGTAAVDKMHQMAKYGTAMGGIGTWTTFQAAKPPPLFGTEWTTGVRAFLAILARQTAAAYGPPGRVLPAGSYSIGMPYLGYPGHYGADYPAPMGTPVYAPWAATVSRAATLTGSYGQHVFLNHGAGIETRYAHLQHYYVGPGQQVSAGQLIGRVDSTGNSTGSHLHFEYRRNGVAINPATLGLFDRGGWLPHGGMALNMSGSPERVLSPAESKGYGAAAIRDALDGATLQLVGVGTLTDAVSARIVLASNRRAGVR